MKKMRLFMGMVAATMMMGTSFTVNAEETMNKTEELINEIESYYTEERIEYFEELGYENMEIDIEEDEENVYVFMYYDFMDHDYQLGIIIDIEDDKDITGYAVIDKKMIYELEIDSWQCL